MYISGLAVSGLAPPDLGYSSAGRRTPEFRFAISDIPIPFQFISIKLPIFIFNFGRSRFSRSIWEYRQDDQSTWRYGNRYGNQDKNADMLVHKKRMFGSSLSHDMGTYGCTRYTSSNLTESIGIHLSRRRCRLRRSQGQPCATFLSDMVCASMVTGMVTVHYRLLLAQHRGYEGYMCGYTRVIRQASFHRTCLTFLFVFLFLN